MMEELTAAELRYDANAVDRLLNEGFVYVGNDGSLTSRVDFLGLTNRDRNPLELLEITDIEVRTAGNTAIATGLIHEKGLINGQHYEFRGRTLTTFVRKAGHWRCLAIHDYIRSNRPAAGSAERTGGRYRDVARLQEPHYWIAYSVFHSSSSR